MSRGSFWDTPVRPAPVSQTTKNEIALEEALTKMDASPVHRYIITRIVALSGYDYAFDTIAGWTGQEVKR